MTSFEKMNCDGEYDRFTFRQRDTDDEIQGSMGPLIVGDWQRVKKELGFFDDLFWADRTARDEGPVLACMVGHKNH